MQKLIVQKGGIWGCFIPIKQNRLFPINLEVGT